MEKPFNFERLRNHQFYHLRYGRGAVIVAVPLEDETTARVSWENIQTEIAAGLRAKRRPIQRRIRELENSRPNTIFGDEYRQHLARTAEMIAPLEQELRHLSYQRREYFSALQVAQFYTHRYSQQNETGTRFDRVSHLDEGDTHLTITLDFSDRSNHQDPFQRMAGLSTHTGGYQIEGQVRRMVPLSQVSLEIIERISPQKAVEASAVHFSKIELV